MASGDVGNDARAQAWEAQSRLRALASTLADGSVLPSERDLAKRWGVSKAMLRKGVDVLITEGQLVAGPGSHVTVAQHPMTRTLGLSSFSNDMRARGKVPSTRVISFATVAADEELATSLGVAKGTPLFSFTRLRFGDGEPVAVELSWIPSDLVPGLTASDIEGSLYETLEAKYALTPRRASTILSAAPTSADEAHLLGMQPGQPCLRFSMIDRTVDGRPFMLAICSYHAERYQLRAELMHNHDGLRGGA